MKTVTFLSKASNLTWQTFLICMLMFFLASQSAQAAFPGFGDETPHLLRTWPMESNIPL